MKLELSKKNLQEKLTNCGLFSLIGLGFSIPISTSLTTIFTILTSLCWLGSGKARETYGLFSKNPVIRAALLLFVLFLIGITYSSVGLNEALHGLNTYRKLFLIVIFSSFIQEERHKTWGIYAFFLGSFVLLTASCISFWHVFPTFSLRSNTISSRITHSIFMAFFAFGLAVSIMEKQRFRAIYGALFCLTVYNLFFVVNGRSGYVIFFALIIFFFYHYFDKKKFLLGVIVMLLLLLSTLLFHNKFSERMLATKNNIELYQQAGNNNTSIGQRLDFAKTSFLLVLKKPVFGYGTGSFKKEYKILSRQIATFQTDNPHNEYLSIGVQLGFVGIIIFVYLLGVQWQCTKHMAYNKVFAQGFVVSMAIGSLLNSMLLDSGEGHFFAYFTALLFATLQPQPGADAPRVEL